MPGYIERAANQIADILMREGLDYTQTKAVFKQARTKAGLHAPKESRGSPARLTLEEELCFIDQAYAQGGQVGLMMQVLLETGARVSEFVALRVEDVSLAERALVIEDGKGGKRREVPMRPGPGPSSGPAHRPPQVRAAVCQSAEARRWASARLHPPAHLSPPGLSDSNGTILVVKASCRPLPATVVVPGASAPPRRRSENGRRH